MTAPVSAAPGRVRAWVMTHQQQAAAGAGGLAIVAFALLKKRQAGPDASTGDAAAVGAATDSTGTGLTAGLSGTPFTGDTDAYNAIQEQLNEWSAAINEKLTTPTAPAAPAAPKPIPKPGASRYTIVAGDTIAGIAAKTMGGASEANINAIKLANPVLMGWSPKVSLNFFHGNVLVIPKPVVPGPTRPPVVRNPPTKKPPKKTPAKSPSPKRP